MCALDLTPFEGTPYAEMVDSSGVLEYVHGTCGDEDRAEFLEYVTSDLHDLGHKLTNISLDPDRITGIVEKMCPECKGTGGVDDPALFDGVNPESAWVECPSCTPETLFQHEASRAPSPW